MAQKIFLDTSLLIEDGRTQAEYEADPDWDPAIFGIVDTFQVFDLDTVYFYFPTLNLFYKSTETIHAVYRAAETLFTQSRWEEISDLLDEFDIWRMLNTFDLAVAKRKIIRARDRGFITVAEVQSLAALVAHLPGA